VTAEADCPFCAIIRGDAPPDGILANWGDCIALTPLNPVRLGHTLIIPTLHVEDALTMPTVTGLVFARAAEYAGWQGAHGYNLITSVGAVATQTVFHLHVHVLPRRPDDGVRLPWSPA
jgi:histidine triad (HIT) family protein